MQRAVLLSSFYLGIAKLQQMVFCQSKFQQMVFCKSTFHFRKTNNNNNNTTNTNTNTTSFGHQDNFVSPEYGGTMKFTIFSNCHFLFLRVHFAEQKCHCMWICAPATDIGTSASSPPPHFELVQPSTKTTFVEAIRKTFIVRSSKDDICIEFVTDTGNVNHVMNSWKWKGKTKIYKKLVTH